VLVIGAGGDLSYDPVVDAWRSLPDPPFRLPDLVSDNERFEAAWSGDVFYVWRPASDEMALYDPEVDRWEPMSAPGLDSDPVALLADGERLVALGTGWPGGAAPVSLDVDSAEWRNGRWVRNEPMTFATASQQSAADVGAAALVGGSVVVWGDGGAEAGPTYLLGPDGGQTPAPPMPIEAGLGHPGSVPLGDRLLALSEGPDAAIYDPETRAWTVAVLAAAGENGADRGPGIRADGAVWTGSELLAWTGSGLFRWSPPEAGSPGSPGSSAAGDAGP
jgi:hypothetical protein